MRVAFDVDDTLWKVRSRKTRGGDCVLGCAGDNHECGNYSFDQVPDYDLIQVLRWFAANGDEVFVWSAGGKDYAEQIMRKLGLDELVKVIDKSTPSAAEHDIDICFDDQSVVLARTNVKVKRS